MAHLCFALDSFGHDVFRDTYNIALVRDSDAVLQTVKTRLLTHYEEWFLDLDAGLPYFTEIMIKNPNMNEIESMVIREIAETDGVVNVLGIHLSSLPDTRSLLIDFSYTDVYGRIIRGSING